MTKPSTIDVLKGEFYGYEVLTQSGATPYVAPKKVEVRNLVEEEKRDSIRSLLTVGKWTVEFTKVDGTQSIMECTLDPKLLPEVDATVAKSSTRPEQPHLLHVYATDRKGWRSFVVGNLVKMYRTPEDL
jgi:hypothetical protein